jgi:hypothetical protein
VAAAEQNYHGMRDRVSVAVRRARLVLMERNSEVEAFTNVYYTLNQTDPAW